MCFMQCEQRFQLLPYPNPCFQILNVAQDCDFWKKGTNEGNSTITLSAGSIFWIAVHSWTKADLSGLAELRRLFKTEYQRGGSILLSLSLMLLLVVQLLSGVRLCEPRELQHARLPCPSLSPRVCPNSYPLSRRYHPMIASSVVPFSSRPQYFPASGSFSNKSALQIRWPKYWTFSFSIHPSNEYSVLVSFRIDWFDLLVVQRTLKSLLQHHSLKASILQHSAFFIVQLSHDYWK